MVMLGLIVLIGSVKAGPIALGRQLAISQTSESAQGDNSTAAIPISAIIAISSILGVGILIVAFVSPPVGI